MALLYPYSLDKFSSITVGRQELGALTSYVRIIATFSSGFSKVTDVRYSDPLV